MRSGITWWLLLALLGSAALGACGATATLEQPGALTLGFTTVAAKLPELTLSTATMRLEHLSVFGDVGPPPHGPPGPSMSDVDFDALATTPTTRTFAMLPEGIYSRVHFDLERIALSGAWRGTPFEARLAMFRGPMVGLRSATGHELGPGHDVTFSITVDTGGWFAGALLDGAVVANGRITCDFQSNPSIAMELTNRISNSFSLQ